MEGRGWEGVIGEEGAGCGLIVAVSEEVVMVCVRMCQYEVVPTSMPADLSEDEYFGVRVERWTHEEGGCGGV